MASVLRFCRHHPDYLLVEYKPLLQHVMKHVKNLRSQVNNIDLNNVPMATIAELNPANVSFGKSRSFF